MTRPTVRSLIPKYLALALSLSALTPLAHAQQAEDEFSLDDETPGEARTKPKPAPSATETAAAAEAEPDLLGDEQALAEEQAPDEKFRESTDPYEDPKKHYIFAGATWRYIRLPSFILNLFLDEAPSVGSAGSFFGEVAYRKDGFQVTGQLGWMKLDFTGPFRLSGDPINDTEYLDTKFNFLMATATVTWSTSFTDWLAIEYGVEAGLAAIFGDMMRTEAYKSGGKWQPCQAWAPRPGLPNPNWTGGAPTPEQLEGCEVPDSTGAVIPPSNQAGEQGEHYNVKANKGIANDGVPHVVPIIGPRVSLRFKPIHQLVLRVDVPLPLFPFGFVGGLSAQFGF